MPWDTYGSECPDCEEKVIAFKYKGERYDLHVASGRYIIHQCPQYVEECWPDDPNVRDSDGNMRSADWSDDTDRVRDLSDDEWKYPDVPYVAPNWEYWNK